MIKGIIEKVILNYFGKFIKGVERDNLSVDLFGGNFKIENINLNEEFFDKLEVPIKLAYSSIGKLNMQVPLSKISSVPVECILDNIFIIFEFKDEAFGEKQRNDSEQKRKAIEKYAKDCLEQFLAKLKEDRKEGGMMSKLGMKIVDNLQLKLVNLHVRFEENTPTKKYSWGVTLQEIVFVTTNSEWKPSFIDRSSEQNRNATMFKTMDVRNLDIYWNYKNVKFLKPELPVVIQDRMAKLIHERSEDKVISITSQFRLRINPLNNFSKPVYELDIRLDPLQVSLEQLQVSQVIDFLERLVIHNEMKLMTRKKTEKIENLNELMTVYQKHLNNMLAGDQNEIEKAQLEQVWHLIPADQLMTWTIPEIKKIVKREKLTELEQKKKGRGWWGTRQNVEITQEQLLQLEELVENTFQNQSQSVRPASCQYFSTGLTIPAGKFIFVKNNHQKQSKETVEFAYNRFSLGLSKSEDESFMEVDLKLKSIKLDINDFEGKEVKRSINVLRSLQQSKQDSNFLDLTHKKNIGKDSQIISTVVGVDKLICIYRNLYLKKFRQLFTFRSVDEIMKSATLEQFEKIQDSGETKIELVQRKPFVQVKIASPTLIVPFNDDSEGECWVWNFGNLRIDSVEDKSEQAVNYQLYNLKLREVSLQYFPSMELCYQPNVRHPDIFAVLHDMNFEVDLRERRALADAERLHKRVIDIKLEEFGVNFTQKQYRNLVHLGAIFSKHDKDRLESLKQEKDELWSKKSHEGLVKKRNETVKNWEEYYAVLSGAYLYFYKNKRELKFVQKVYIKNSKVEIADACLEVANRYEGCILRTQSAQELQSWKEALNFKIKQYATNVQLIELYEKSASKEEEPKEIKYEKKTSFTFCCGVAYFTYESDSKVELMNCRVLQLKLSQQSETSQSRTSLTFEQLYIEDKVFIYEKSTYQPLIWVKSNGENKPKLVFYRNEEGKVKGFKNRSNVKVSVKIPFLQLNWKPDVLLLLLDLIKKYVDRNQAENLREDDFEMRTRGQCTIDRQTVLSNLLQNDRFMEVSQWHDSSSNKVKESRQKYLSLDEYSKLKPNIDLLLSMEVQLEAVDIYLMHRQTHVILFNLVADNLSVSVVLTEDEKFVSGCIKDLNCYEMTNYPNTQNSNIEHEQIHPYRIIRRAAGNDSDILKFRWSSYNNRTFINNERVNGFLCLEASPVEYHYFQQVTFRMIDYTLIQIILLLTNPDMVVANQNLLSQLEQNIAVSELPILVWGKYEEIAKRLINPFFGDMYITLQRPQVFIKAEPASETYFIAHIAQVILYNYNIKDDRRFRTGAVDTAAYSRLMNFIWEENTVIQAKDIELKIVVEKPANSSQSIQEPERFADKPFEKPLWCPISLSLTVNRLLNEDEIKHVYPEVENYDRGFYIDMVSDEVRLDCDRSEYLHIMKLLNFNITYDDEKDNLFIHNYRITKLLSPKPIIFKFNIPVLTLTAAYYYNKQIETLFSITFEPMVVTFERGKDLNCKVGISAPQLNVSNFKEHRQTPILRCPETASSEITTKLEIELKTNGTKIIMLYIESAKIVLKLNIFELILEWVQVDDSIFPVPSSYVNEILFCTNINNVIIAIESDTTGKVRNALTALGTLSYKFSRRKNRTEEFYRNQLQQGTLTIADIEGQQQCSYMTLSLNVQLLRCRYDNFISSSFKKIAKRCIIYPVTFNFTQKIQLQVADISKFLLKTSAKRNINIDRTIAKFSCRDLELLTNIVEHKNQEEQYYRPIWEHIKSSTLATVGGLHKAVFLPVPSVKVSNEASSMDTIDLQFESLSFYVINNYGQSLVPVIQLVTEETQMKRLVTIKKSITEVSFNCSLNYYNGSILKWEPVVQKTRININNSCYFGDKPKQMLTFENTTQLLFNVSKELVGTVLNTIGEWKGFQKGKEEQHVPLKLESEVEEPIQFVSHYIVVNETGYPLEIYDSQLQLRHRVENGCQINYNVQLDSCQLAEADVVVSVRIVHPRLKLKPIDKINLNSNIARRVFPICEGNANFCCGIMLRPTYINEKQYYYITSCLKIADKATSDNLREYYMPFDQNLRTITLTSPLKIELSIDKLRKSELDQDFYRYTLTSASTEHYFSTITITHKYTATNLLPVPINVNGVVLQPYKSTGFRGELLINGDKFNKTAYKTFHKQNEVYIYCQAYFVDYYGLEIALEQNKQLLHRKYLTELKLKNEKATVGILPAENSRIALRIRDRNKFSKPFEPALGRMFVEISDPDLSCEFSVTSYLKPVNPADKDNQLFQKVIEFTSRYMIVNSTSGCIKVNQVDSLISTTLEPQERQPFFWESQKKPKKVRISTFDENSFWGYSGPLSLEQNSQCFTLRKAEQQTLYRVFRCELEPTDHVNYINITEESTKFRLQNTLQDVIMTVYQVGIFQSDEIINPEKLVFRVGPGETIPFGYEFPAQNRKIQVGVEFLNEQLKKVYAQPLEVDMEAELFTKRIFINRDGKRMGYYTIRLDFEGSTKKLSLVDRDIEQVVDEEPQFEIAVRVNKLGLSLIGSNHKSLRVELMYLQLDKILYEQSSTNQRTEHSLVVQGARIDNQRAIKVLFPITLEALASPYLQFRVSLDKLNSKLVHYIGLSINKSAISITSEELRILYENVNEISNNPSLLAQNPHHDIIIDYDFKGRVLGKQEEKFYFVAAEIHPFKGNLCFKHTNNWGGKLFKTFSNISECKIKVNGQKIEHFTCTSISGFINQVANHYKENILDTILPLIGNMSILGNPVSLVNRIGSGFKDLYDLPAEGFETSALEGGKGLARGARSLFQNTFQGAFGSVEAITDTIGTGLSSFVDDQEYQTERQKIRNDRSEHLFDGLWNGGKSLVNGIQNGLKGVVMDPLRGAEKNGVGGFFLGLAKGFSGLVLKPVSSLVDATTKTAEGIKNTADYLNPKEKQKRNRRVRPPRPFYTMNSEYKIFDSSLAQINMIIGNDDEKEQFETLHWQSYYCLEHKMYLLLTYEYLIFYDFGAGKLVRFYESKLILKCQEERTTNKVLFSILKGGTSGDLKIVVNENRHKLISDVRTIIKFYHCNT